MDKKNEYQDELEIDFSDMVKPKKKNKKKPPGKTKYIVICGIVLCVLGGTVFLFRGQMTSLLEKGGEQERQETEVKQEEEKDNTQDSADNAGNPADDSQKPAGENQQTETWTG